MRYRWLLVATLVLWACDDEAGPHGAVTLPGEDVSTSWDSTWDAGDDDAHAADSPADTAADSGFDADVGSTSTSDADAALATDAPAGDAAAADQTQAPDSAIGTDASSGPFSVLLASADDALASYLMDAGASAWNVFSGAVVPLGRHSGGANVSYHTALRFTGVQVPAGAKVASAKVTFHPTNEVDSSHALWLNVYAEKVPDSKAFDPKDVLIGRPDQRAKTQAHVDHWLVRCNAGCTDLSEYDCAQRKLDCWNREVAFTVPKDLKALVQEVVDQPGWKAGNALTILVINSATDQDGPKYQDHRSITGFDPDRGPQFSPRLTIQVAP